MLLEKVCSSVELVRSHGGEGVVRVDYRHQTMRGCKAILTHPLATPVQEPLDFDQFVMLVLEIQDGARIIRESSGFGTQILDCSPGIMIHCVTTVSDNLPKSLRDTRQDSHHRSEEDVQGD
jgi:hypothetical protein